VTLIFRSSCGSIFFPRPALPCSYLPAWPGFSFFFLLHNCYQLPQPPLSLHHLHHHHHHHPSSSRQHRTLPSITYIHQHSHPLCRFSSGFTTISSQFNFHSAPLILYSVFLLYFSFLDTPTRHRHLLFPSYPTFVSVDR